METIKVTTTRRYRVPRVPNFILHADDDKKTSIADLSPVDLRRIGIEWTGDRDRRRHPTRRRRTRGAGVA